MEAGNTCVADPVDTVVVHHEMDSTVCNRHVYKPVLLSIRKQWGSELILEKESMANPYNEIAIHGSNKGFLDNWLHSAENLLQITWYYITGRDSVVYYPASVILLGEGGMEKT